jgi:hypothetical protein
VEKITLMAERLVDVLNDKNNLLHVFPVTVEEPDARPTDSDFEQAALKAAIAAEMAPESDAKKLRARPHVSRGGQLAPFGECTSNQARAEDEV